MGTTMATFNGSFFGDTITPGFTSFFVTPLFTAPTAVNDLLNGFEGNDTLDGGGGNDTLNGGTGDDVMTDLAGGNLFNGEDGNDAMTGGFGADVMNGGAGFDTLNGSGGDNRLNGGADADLVTAGGGADTIDGGTGADTMRGGDGSDFYFVDSVFDVVQEFFADPLSGDDTVQASVSFTLSLGIDNLFLAGAGAIAGTGNALNNRIVGNGAANTLRGLAGNDTLNGLGGNDNLDGGDGDDSLLGGDGDDLLISAVGNDVLEGGNGADGFDLNARASLIGLTVSGGAGDDGADLAFGSVALDTVARFSGVERIDAFLTTVQGGAGADNLDFRAFRTVAFGGAAGIAVNGGAGSDLIAGSTSSAAADTLNGQDGADIAFGEGGNDSILGGTGNDFLGGGFGDDTLRGEEGDDTLDGGFDFDLLDGGAGVDTADYRFFSGRANLNLSTGVVDFPDDLDVRTDTLVSIENVLMGAGADTVTGDFGANRIDGGAGNDSLFGGGGGAADTILGGAGNDVIDGGGGADSVFGGDGDDLIFAVLGTPEFIDGGAGVDTLDTAAFAGNYVVNLATGATNFAGEQFLNMENLISGAGNDVLTGSAVANRILGGTGDDRIVGTAGNDSLIGGAGFDTADYAGFGTAVTLRSGGVVAKGALGTDRLGTFDVAAGAVETFERVVGAAGLRNAVDGTSVVGAVNLNVDLAAGSYASTVVVPTGGFAAGTTFGFQIANFTDVLGTNNADTIRGDAAANLLTGAGGDDRIFGSAGDDSMRGGAGFDVADYGALGTAVALRSGGVVGKGALGTDLLGAFDVATGTVETFERVVGAAGLRNLIDGTSVVGAVNLTVDLTAQTFQSTVVAPVGGFAAGATFGFSVVNFVDVTGTANGDAIRGDAGANRLSGAAGADSIRGEAGADLMGGGAGNDALDGGAGGDRLIGGLGADLLRGGDGADVFEFNLVAESAFAASDRILGGFAGAGAAVGDLFDLIDVDADATAAGIQDFVFGTATTKGRLWAANEAGSTDTIVLGNVDADADAEFAVRIEDGAVLASAYAAADFLV
jgi:Ca2+-binding RTX toxin-like protein